MIKRSKKFFMLSLCILFCFVMSSCRTSKIEGINSIIYSDGIKILEAYHSSNYDAKLKATTDLFVKSLENYQNKTPGQTLEDYQKKVDDSIIEYYMPITTFYDECKYDKEKSLYNAIHAYVVQKQLGEMALVLIPDPSQKKAELSEKLTTIYNKIVNAISVKELEEISAEFEIEYGEKKALKQSAEQNK